MSAIEVGRICVKIAGREAGYKCVIVEVIDKNFVLVTGPKETSGIKRRRSNVNHITATEDVIAIERGASDGDIEKVLKAAGKMEEMKERVELTA